MSDTPTIRDRDRSNLPRLGEPRLLHTIQPLRHDPACEPPSYATDIQPWLVWTRPSYLPGQIKCVNDQRRLNRAGDDIPLQPLEPVLRR